MSQQRSPVYYFQTKLVKTDPRAQKHPSEAACRQQCSLRLRSSPGGPRGGDPCRARSPYPAGLRRDPPVCPRPPPGGQKTRKGVVVLGAHPEGQQAQPCTRATAQAAPRAGLSWQHSGRGLRAWEGRGASLSFLNSCLESLWRFQHTRDCLKPLHSLSMALVMRRRPPSPGARAPAGPGSSRSLCSHQDALGSREGCWRSSGPAAPQPSACAALPPLCTSDAS